MNLNNVLKEIEKIDPEVYDRLDTRRSTMKSFAKVGGRVALTAVPFLFGGMFKKAYAGTSSMPSIVDILNYALTLEYLEAAFYKKATSTFGLIPGEYNARWGFNIIADDEAAHVAFLQAAIKGVGATPVAEPTFDFSAGGGSGDGPFKDVFKDYKLLLAVAQVFEDTGVRAYKGQAAGLMSNNTVLTAALDIHSVEARHASHIRNLRSEVNSDRALKPWITGAKTGRIGAIVHPHYAGEQNTMQAGIEIKNINGMDIDEDAASEAFDEPLTMKEVLKLVGPFIVKM